MGEKSFIGVIVAVIIIMFIGGVFLVSKPEYVQQVQPSSNVIAVAQSSSHDWGRVSLGDGNVEKTFEIKNDGIETLSLSSVTTSCMCTTAQLVLGEEVSPEFGMHTKTDYTLEVPSGETAQLVVVFDPAFHGPGGTGAITRQVQVSTNDKDNPILTFNLKALVQK